MSIEQIHFLLGCMLTWEGTSTLYPQIPGNLHDSKGDMNHMQSCTLPALKPPCQHEPHAPLFFLSAAGAHIYQYIYVAQWVPENADHKILVVVYIRLPRALDNVATRTWHHV